MSGKKKNITKLSIIQVGTKTFLESGYSRTTMKYIGEKLGISTGNITFYFPTKEHLLAILVEMLCHFQWEMFKYHMEERDEPIFSLCLELLAMASICDENENAKDFYISSYTHNMSIDIIRRYDSMRAQEIFGEYCPDWDKDRFCTAEIIVSGIEWSVLFAESKDVSLENRVKMALDTIMAVYNVPKELRLKYVEKVFEMDYRALGRRIFNEFYKYIEKKNAEAISLI